MSRRTSDPRRLSRFTTIGEVFKWQIFVCKLLGGFSFECFNKYLAVLYKLLVFFTIKKYKQCIHDFKYDVPDAYQKNWALFLSILTVAQAHLAMTIVIADFRHHNAIYTVLTRPFITPYRQISTSPPEAGLLPARAYSCVTLRKFLNVWLAGLLLVFSVNQWAWEIFVAKQYEMILSTRKNELKNIHHELPALIAPHSSIPMLVAYHLYEIFLRVIEVFLMLGCYAFNLINLLIVAYLADVIQYAYKQLGLLELKKHARCWQARKSTRTDDARAATLAANAALDYQLALLQARDVLLVMKEALGLYYLANYVYALAEICLCIGYLLVYVQAQYSILFRPSLLFVVIDISVHSTTFVVYQLFRMRVRSLGDLVDRQIICGESARVPLTSQARLIREIAEITPTDWIQMDIQIFLRRVIATIVFVIGLQQIASATLHKKGHAAV